LGVWQGCESEEGGASNENHREKNKQRESWEKNVTRKKTNEGKKGTLEKRKKPCVGEFRERQIKRGMGVTHKRKISGLKTKVVRKEISGALVQPLRNRPFKIPKIGGGC